jgi:hypothetical protein
MIFFFGGRKRTTTSRGVGLRNCKKCRAATAHKVVESREAAHLFGAEGKATVNEVLVCAVCGHTSKPSRDAWTKTLRSGRKHRQLKMAMVRGRQQGLRELTDTFGAGTNIDLSWIERHKRDVDEIFTRNLLKEIGQTGLDERDVAPHIPRMVETMKQELRCYVIENPD